ncbi:hypothetical protein PUNSTDRAFT_54190 [Punctularia strigosozonata HHB-11173 SS5]|uniref:uncharacterized protein n=1 Tax=Punctularia strigosozonata (strain HHB-11173) TaxID=741275 RepID=UPI000441823F|nr:uncharacterized protein PUNSTDRAFT_54190 [Punctularia strigosozonata HHB-11173 SS5]EIN06826.1 hypothetical protein PUNSTDRAFT_54190 [Punctularia strigosozonata HHB-11173 SS5]
MFSRFVSAVFLLVAFGFAVALAAPIQTVTSVADVKTVFLTLKSTTDSVVPQINALAVAHNATADNLKPLIVEITTAVQTATNVLKTAKPLVDEVDKDVVELLGSILKDVTVALGSISSDVIDSVIVHDVIVTLDTTVNGLLVVVKAVLGDVLGLVANILFGVAGLLSSIGYALTRATLGL